jgi:hypothetical protein
MLEGDLTDFTLSDILKLLAFTSKTGRLHLAGDHSRGRVDLADGRVHDASADATRVPLARRLLGLGLVDGDQLTSLLRERDELPTDRELAVDLVSRGLLDAEAASRVLDEQTVDAVFDLLQWTEGSFSFRVGDAPDSGPIEVSSKVDNLLEQAESRRERWAEVTERTGPHDAVVAIRRPDHELGAVELDPDAWSLLALIDGKRTVGELVALTGRGSFHTRGALAGLIERGIVKVEASGEGSPVERLVAHHATIAAIEAEHGGAPAPDAAAAVAEVEALEEPPATVDEGHVEDAEPNAPAAEASLAGAFVLDEHHGEAPPPPPSDEAPGAEPADVSDDEVTDELAGVGTELAADLDVEAASGEVRPDDAEDAEVTPIRANGSEGRLATDPTIDEDLVDRLIDGVKEL